MIEINGSELNQWDKGRSVKVTVTGATHVHFANQGDSRAVIMELKDEAAKIPDYLLQTGKQLCVYAVAVYDTDNRVTIEKKTLSVKKRECPADYIYDEDQRNFVYALVKDAQDATEAAEQAAKKAKEVAEQAAQSAVEIANQASQTAVEIANQAATAATKAAQSAGKSASSAVLATDNANVAADSANLAAKSANEAAAKAAHTAKSLMVVGAASGETIVLDDAIDQYLVGLRVFGKTTQDGVPSPDAPVDLVSVENPTIAVNEQSMLVPYTLRGIPVSSGGNYTDANGQQWVCDEVDFAMGVYIQRVGAYAYTGEESWFISTAQNPALVEAGMVRYDAVIAQYPKAATSQVLSSHCRFVGLNSFDEASGIGAWVYADPNYLAVRIVTDIDAVSGLKTWLANQYASSTPVTILYIMAAPIEIPLSEYELTAYATLQTARGITTVSNDAGAYMEIQYVMDAKKYIDSLIGTGGAYAGLVEATVE